MAVALSATQSANFLSGHEWVAGDAHFTGFSVRKTTTMRRTIRLQIRPMRALSGRFLRAMIVEWLFPMNFDKAPSCRQRTPSRLAILSKAGECGFEHPRFSHAEPHEHRQNSADRLSLGLVSCQHVG